MSLTASSNNTVNSNVADGLRIVFMGTPHFAVGVLSQIVEAGHHVVGVITAPDRPAGRGRKLRASAVKEYAEKHQLPVLQPTNLKAESFLEQLRAWQADLQVVVAFRMLPKVVWDLPPKGTFNLHASLLPDFRGAAPINWAIINGVEETGVTTFFIDDQIDTGAIIASDKIAVAPRESFGTLHDKLMELSAELVNTTIELIANDKAVAVAQPEGGRFPKAPKLNSENTQIDWSMSVSEVDRMVRGLSPFPGAWTVIINKEEEFKVKLFAGEPKNIIHSQEPGTIMTTKNTLDVVLSDGVYSVTEIQLPGKRKMDVVSLLNGYTFEAGAKFV